MRASNRIVVVAACLLLAAASVHAQVEVVDFDRLPTGAVVSEVFGDQGTGPVKVRGVNGWFAPDVNAAVIFDSAIPTGGDFDLGAPNEVFGGPGKGIGGERGTYKNDEPLGKLLIIAENLVDVDGDGLIDDPDDEGKLGRVDFEFDFSEVGPVTLHRMTLIDVEERERTPTVRLLGAGGALLLAKELDITGDNGRVRIPLGPTPGVLKMVVELHGSGAISSIRFEPSGPPPPSIDIEKLTNGSQADLPTDADVPFVMVGDPVTWTYIVTNTGLEELQNVSVTDDRGVAVSCPKPTLAPGETMECAGAGVAVDLAGKGLDFEPVPGLCRSKESQPLYGNVGYVSGVGTISELTVTDSDPSHYCSGIPELPNPGIYVRKQKKGPDTRGISSGTRATFEIYVKNTGTVDLTDVKVSDVLSPDCDRQIGRLAAGESKVYKCTAPALAIGGEYVNDCSFVNEVVATGQGGGRTVTDSDTSTLELMGLEIEKSFTGVDDKNANFKITVTNTGCDLDEVVVTDKLAPDCEKTFALEAGQANAYTYTCTMPLEFTNEACADGAGAGGTVSACGSVKFVVGDGKPPEPPKPPKPPEPPQPPDKPTKPTKPASNWLLLLALALLVGGGLFAWNRMKAG